MALPASAVAEFYEQLKVYAGKEGSLQIADGFDPPALASFKPVDKIGVGGKSPSVAAKSAFLAGGVDAVAKVMTITVGAVPADGETVTVDGTALTFDGSTPTANQIDTTSGTAAGVAIQLAQEINQQVSTVSATVAGTIVTVTADTPGDDYAITDDTSGDLTIATTTANVVAVSAETDVVFDGTQHKAGCQDEVAIAIELNGKGRIIRFIVDRASDSTTNAARATAMKACLAAGLGDTAPAAGSRIKGRGGNDSTTDLSDAMQLIFGSDPDVAFTIASATLTLTALVGEDGNNVSVTTRVRNSFPSPIPLPNAAGLMHVPGIKTVGDFTGFNVQAPQQFGEYQPTNSRGKRRVPTVADLTVTFGLYFNTQLEILEEGSGSSAVSYGDDGNILSINGAALANILNGKAIFFVFENDDGGYDFVYIYSALFANLAANYAIEALDATELQATPQFFSSRKGDPFGIIYQAAA